MMSVGIGSAAILLGVSIVTLRRWEALGRLLPARRTAGGHRRSALADLRQTNMAEDNSGLTGCYARVSCHDQKDDLARPAQRLAGSCQTRGFTAVAVIQDLGSGLNVKTRGLSRLLDLLCRQPIGRLVIEHKDRLLRFGSELLFRLCANLGIAVVIIEPPSDKIEDRLVADVLELMTVFSAKLYGSRSHQRRRAAIC
ncbi:MAG: family transposase OrfA [Rhodospirillales bacterium]|nr:family transposase OrfA [Rhodospirillales bacterium]